MKYVSTRGRMSEAAGGLPFCSILLEGLAVDGGLAVPERYPAFTPGELREMRPLGYRELAWVVLSKFIDDIPSGDLKRLVDATYTAQVFGSDDVTPLATLEPGFHLLQVSNGPTLAFKDIALQLVGRLFEYVLAAGGRTLNVLGATSGDTGSSAEHALLGKKGVAVFMLSPHGRMSPFQQAQMFSLVDPSIHNLAIEGTFDDCQDIVKTLAGDVAFKRRHRLGAVNSINWARIAAQVVYYFKGYFASTTDNSQAVQFAVPSGNFGNILSAHVARQMGLPIGRLILATNENDVLDEFFRTGVYRPRRASETHVTSSPSMDISKASNFERFMFDVVDRDPAALAALWKRLEDEGSFDLAGTARWSRVQGFAMVSGRSSHADRLATIRDIDQRYGRVVDPHTADGIKVGRELRDPSMPLVCVETALPAKFRGTIREALGRDPACPAGFEGLESRPQRREVLPARASAVADYIRRNDAGAVTER